jgi:hypothetical protein
VGNWDFRKNYGVLAAQGLAASGHFLGVILDLHLNCLDLVLDSKVCRKLENFRKIYGVCAAPAFLGLPGSAQTRNRILSTDYRTALSGNNGVWRDVEILEIFRKLRY